MCRSGQSMPGCLLKHTLALQVVLQALQRLQGPAAQLLPLFWLQRGHLANAALAQARIDDQQAAATQGTPHASCPARQPRQSNRLSALTLPFRKTAAEAYSPSCLCRRRCT